MQTKGKLLTCDRCGATAFADRTDDVKLDGGHTCVESYKSPKGWGTWSNPYIFGPKDLCPDCFNLCRAIESRQKVEWRNFIAKED